MKRQKRKWEMGVPNESGGRRVRDPNEYAEAVLRSVESFPENIDVRYLPPDAIHELRLRTDPVLCVDPFRSATGFAD